MIVFAIVFNIFCGIIANTLYTKEAKKERYSIPTKAKIFCICFGIIFLGCYMFIKYIERNDDKQNLTF